MHDFLTYPLDPNDAEHAYQTLRNAGIHCELDKTRDGFNTIIIKVPGWQNFDGRVTRLMAQYKRL